MSALYAESVGAVSGPRAANGLRSAALMLHAMSIGDRNWLLGQVSAEQREGLLPLLTELASLGMRVDPEWLHQALHPNNEAPLSANQSVRQQVAAAPVAAVFGILVREPSRLVARVLMLADWPWRDEVLAQLRSRRGDVFECVSMGCTDAGSLPAKLWSELDRSVLRHLACRLERAQREARPATTPGARTWWRRAARWTRG